MFSSDTVCTGNIRVSDKGFKSNIFQVTIGKFTICHVSLGNLKFFASDPVIVKHLPEAQPLTRKTLKAP